MNGGDALARGAKSAQFPASSFAVSQEKWDSIWEDSEPISVQITVVPALPHKPVIIAAPRKKA